MLHYTDINPTLPPPTTQTEGPDQTTAAATTEPPTTQPPTTVPPTTQPPTTEHIETTTTAPEPTTQHVPTTAPPDATSSNTGMNVTTQTPGDSTSIGNGTTVLTLSTSGSVSTVYSSTLGVSTIPTVAQTDSPEVTSPGTEEPPVTVTDPDHTTAGNVSVGPTLAPGGNTVIGSQLCCSQGLITSN